MFPLSHMLKSFVRTGTLKVIDADGKTHVFAGKPGGPDVTMRLTDPTLYRKLFFNPELHAGEAYMNGRLTFENSTLRDFINLFSLNRLRLGSYPLQRMLRRISRDGPALLGDRDPARLNTPQWLWDSWTESYGEEATRAIAAAHLIEAPLDLTTRSNTDFWAGRLEGEVLPTGSIRREGGGNVTELPGFAEGAWWVQDAAATLPARLLGDISGKQVADLCAAPGGKTLQLAAAGAAVTAVDIRPRMVRVGEKLARAGCRHVGHADAGKGSRARAATPLLDAPARAPEPCGAIPILPAKDQKADGSRLRIAAGALRDLLRLGHADLAVCPQEGRGPARVTLLAQTSAWRA